MTSITLLSTRKTETGPPLPFPPLPSPSLCHVFYIVLYCTILYYTVLYCTPSLQPSLPVSKSLFASRRSRAGWDWIPTYTLVLFAALSRLFRLLCAASSRNVVFTKTDPGQLERESTHSQMTSTVARSGHDLFYLIEKDDGDCSFICPLRATVRGRWFANGHYYLIQVKNRAWSPSLPFFPSLLPFPSPSRFLHCTKKKKKKKKATRGKKKTFRKQILPKVDVLVPKHHWNFKNS